jgi:hypothetical protein
MCPMFTPRRLLGFSISVSWLFGAGCGPGGNGKIPPDPPQARILAESSTVADTTLRLNLEVNGCSDVAAVTLVDGETKVKDLTFEGNPTPVEVLPNEISYKSGIAAHLSLRVLVECADGRVLKSQPTSVQFLPVASSILGPNNEQAVPDLFYVRGNSAGAIFGGCVGQPNGTTALAEVDAQGTLLREQTQIPVPCSGNALITDRNPVSGKRWLLEPGVGAFSFDDNLNTYTAVTQFPPSRVTVAYNGDAIIFEGSFPGLGMARFLEKPEVSTGKTMAWDEVYMPNGEVIGDPVVRTDGTLVIPVFQPALGDPTGMLKTEVISFQTGLPVGPGFPLFVITGSGSQRPAVPPGILSPDGQIIYFPVETTPGSSYIIACSATPASGDCPANQKWKTENMSSRIVTLIPFAQGSRLAAIGPQKTFFLEAATGKILNKDNPVSATGNLVTRFLQVGNARDLYLLTGSPSGGYPVEVIAVDSAETGEAYRFQTGTGRVMVGVDSDGQAWLGIGKQLVKPLSLTQYRLAREQ